MKLYFSIIIPVFNRPLEVEELLLSLMLQTFDYEYEVLLIEDGSTDTCEHIFEKYKHKLNIKYFPKENSGAGQSRNYGMERALGNYFIILDSDVILPNSYLKNVSNALEINFTDAYGGADAAHSSFTVLQKAINYSMTSVLTTGGIRGKKKGIGKFQPRSFNMGLSKNAFVTTKGFSKMTYGEDIDLSFRLWKQKFNTQLIDTAFVYHKRRTSIKQFYNQTFNFGTARPILNKEYPTSAKITYWFPSVFIIGFDVAIVLAIFWHWVFLLPFTIYFFLLFFDSLFQNKNLKVAFLSIITSYTQFLGYGLGFLKSIFSRT